MNTSSISQNAVHKLESLGVRRLIKAACILTLIAIALMSWSVLDPTPLPVMMALSIGEAIGALGLLCYLTAVLIQQRKQRAEAATTK